MLTWLTPDLRLASVLELQPGHLQRLRLWGLLLDVDCTLKDHHATEVGPLVRGWLELHRAAGTRLCLLSNGRATRIGEIARTLNLPYVARALKPLPHGCWAGVKLLGLPTQRTAVVGDQLFADVMAGRLAGLFTILVQPTSPIEPWFTRMKRPLERQALRRMRIPTLATNAVGISSPLG